MAKDWIKEAAEKLATRFMVGRHWDCKADYDLKRASLADDIRWEIRSHVPVSEEWISAQEKLPELEARVYRNCVQSLHGLLNRKYVDDENRLRAYFAGIAAAITELERLAVSAGGRPRD